MSDPPRILVTWIDPRVLKPPKRSPPPHLPFPFLESVENSLPRLIFSSMIQDDEDNQMSGDREFEHLHTVFDHSSRRWCSSARVSPLKPWIEVRN
ncbi:hypothetical protein L1987_24626 [Smallanthus sonchifolius]|uniref:Uncharacterized protein n=1 Tax=Smallanthus sonchifolius TaxID=185202 RepID=A0ACB9IMA8_9ASTR|nr:hypothetical protein L1987_24626 [Smallanthus sonchifolius]